MDTVAWITGGIFAALTAGLFGWGLKMGTREARQGCAIIAGLAMLAIAGITACTSEGRAPHIDHSDQQ